MMKTIKETLELALEALEKLVRFESDSWELGSCRIAGQAIKTLREALAEPQEKYQYGTPLLDAMRGNANEALDKKAENARKLGLDYEPAQQEPVECANGCRGFVKHSPPAQRTWVGLTDEQLDDVYFCVEGGSSAIETWREQARAIEARLKENNT